jgi:hypothetical protein
MPSGRSGKRHSLTIKSGASRGKIVHLGGGKRVYGALIRTTKKGAYKKGAKKIFKFEGLLLLSRKNEYSQLLL